MGKRYTKEQAELVKNMWPTHTYKEIARVLNKSFNSVKTKITKLRKKQVNLVYKKPVADIIGKVYGRLTVVSVVGHNKFFHKKMLCQCACGNTMTTMKQNLVQGRSKRCGLKCSLGAV